MKTHLTAEQLREEAKRHPKNVLRASWGQFVARWQWEWFVSLTFQYDTHPERALKLFRVWISKLNREIYGPRWHRKEPYGVEYVVAVEYQKSGRVHLHALISRVGDTRRLTWMDFWLDLDDLAGFARIEPVNNQDAVANYVTKYVTKGGEIDFSPNLRERHPDLFDPPAGSESGTREADPE